jgi:methyltransferase (TIGR00027 family)
MLHLHAAPRFFPMVPSTDLAGAIPEPSGAAFDDAAHRAAHQLLEGGKVFYDPLAVALTGADPKHFIRDREAYEAQAAMRNYLCTRARFGEDAVADAVDRGATQCVILGAGLDSFAYRSPFGRYLRVFEVDQAGMAAWKRARLASLGIACPPWLYHAGCDAGDDGIIATLSRAGFDRYSPTVFLWLGVTLYLPREAVLETMAAIGALPGGAILVFDIMAPIDSMPPGRREELAGYAASSAAAGEPWRSFFTEDEILDELAASGFTRCDVIDADAMSRRYSRGDDVPHSHRGAAIVRAASGALV